MSIIRLDPALDELLPKHARIEKLAGGFTFTEGPLWRPGGVLWFSDVIGNVTRQWSPEGRVIELLRPGGYDGNGLPAGGFIGPNGCTAGKDGTVVLCQHGNRRIVSLDPDMTVSTVVDNFEGRKLNSPNDLVYRSDGTLYFTDPPYGLPLSDRDPSKELPFNGVFSLKAGKLRLLVDDMTRPNGLAFSPDEKTLYVANSDEHYRIWMRFDVTEDGGVKNGRVFADVSASPEAGLPDGMKIDSRGNLWATGPGGIWVFTPEGTHLGTIKPPEQPANCAWGDADWKTLYITAVTGIYRIRTSVAGQTLVYS
jgi:gluconolactonase